MPPLGRKDPGFRDLRVSDRGGSILFTSSFAQTASGAPPEPGGPVDVIIQLIPFALIAIAWYYFFVFRPQRKSAKQHTDLGRGYFDTDSSTTRYLAAAAYTDRVFRETAIRITDDEFRATAPEFGIDSGLVLQHCRIAKRRKALRDVALCVPLLVLTLVFSGALQAPDQFFEIVQYYKLPLIGCWGLAALIAFIHYFLTDYITLARRFSIKHFCSTQQTTPIQIMDKRNVVVYGAFSPFVGSGFDLGGWSFAG